MEYKKGFSGRKVGGQALRNLKACVFTCSHKNINIGYYFLLEGLLNMSNIDKDVSSKEINGFPQNFVV